MSVTITDADLATAKAIVGPQRAKEVAQAIATARAEENRACEAIARKAAEVLATVLVRLEGLRWHACAGFDCNVCEPSQSIEDLQAVISALLGIGK